MPDRAMSFDETWRNTSSRWACVKKKNAWTFQIPEISQKGVETLPPSKAARPGVSLKKFDAVHLAETVGFPGRVEFKPITLTLYDLKKNAHPVWNWIRKVYDARNGTMNFPCPDGFKKTAYLKQFSACGNLLDTWVIEECWPEDTQFGELDYQDGGILTCDISLSYTRAYLIE